MVKEWNYDDIMVITWWWFRKETARWRKKEKKEVFVEEQQLVQLVGSMISSRVVAFFTTNYDSLKECRRHIKRNSIVLAIKTNS